jgi:3-oxoacyl-[acyl-carrier-protein] synthase II
MKKRIVISGIGCVTPIGNNINEYWTSLYNGNCGAGLITRFDNDLEVKVACEVKKWNPIDYFDRKDINRYARHNLYAFQSIEQAINDANIHLDSINKDKIGVIFSSCFGGIELFERERNNNNPKHCSSYLIPNLASDMTAGIIAVKYNLKGVNYAMGSACSSSLDAIIEAYKIIENNEADIMIAGGTEAPITEMIIGGFTAMKALTKKKAEPKTLSRPFDTERDGFVLGEGAGCVIVENYESAYKRGATIYAEIIGYGRDIDTYHITSPNPTGISAYHSMNKAVKMAEIQPSQIDFINAHATSTPLGDISEAKAIEKMFSDVIEDIRVSAIKSMTGHLLGASGVISMIASILSIKYSAIPPIINLLDVDPVINPNIKFICQKSEALTQINTSLINSFGFGGKNSSVLIKKTDY